MKDAVRPDLDEVGVTPTPDQSAQNNAMAHLMIDSIRDYAVFMLDPEGNVLSWNVGASRIMGYAPHEILGRHFSCFYSEGIRDSLPRKTLDAAARLDTFGDEGWLIRGDGGRFWATVVVERVSGPAGRAIGFAVVIRDVSERRIAEDALRKANEELEQRVEERTRELTALNVELARLADTDPLTGIFNRRGFLHVALHETRRSKRYKTPFSVLYIDIDDFKAINDTHGHVAGDGALRRVVRQMGEQLRGGDVMARLGGDEFVLLLLETTSDRAIQVGKRLCDNVASADTGDIVTGSFPLSVSIGAAQWIPEETIDTLLARADMALSNAKISKRRGSVVAATPP